MLFTSCPHLLLSITSCKPDKQEENCYGRAALRKEGPNILVVVIPKEGWAHMAAPVAVSCGYSTYFAISACDGLCHLTKVMDRVGTPFVNLCQTTGLHGLYFDYCFSGPLPLCSLINGPPIGVRFRESLVIRLYSEIDQIHLGIEA